MHSGIERGVLRAKRARNVPPRFLSHGAVCLFLLSTKASTVYVGYAEMHRTKASTVYAGYARRRVPRATGAKRRLLARGEVAFAKQMTEGAFREHPLSHRIRGDSSPINGGAFGAEQKRTGSPMGKKAGRNIPRTLRVRK